MHQYMNYPAEIIRALSTCIDKQEAMFHFTLPEFDHPSGFLDALAVRLLLELSISNITNVANIVVV